MTTRVLAPAAALLLTSAAALAQTPLHQRPAPITEWPQADQLPAQQELPDPLAAPGGGRVQDAADWAEARRRLLPILEEYGYGHAPPPPANVQGEQIESKTLLDGAVLFRRVRITFGGKNELGFEIARFTPADRADEALPTIVNLGFGGGERGAGRFLPVLQRGYAVVAINYNQLGADRPNYRESAFFPTYPGYDWNDMAAWSWGLSRCIDYLVEQPDVAADKIIALGVSRVGHAVLHAGAFDERIALVAPVGAGCAFRFCGKGRGGKEGLDEVIRNVDYWFGPRVPEFVGKVERLPWDQHWLVALAAPRRIILCDALDDPYCQGNAIAQAFLGAKPTFETLGVPDRVAVHFRPGGHGIRQEDWDAILDFADQQLMGRNHGRQFHQLPPADQLK